MKGLLKTITLSLLVLASISCKKQNRARDSRDFNRDWEFSLKLTNQGAKFSKPKKINLPHDWSVEYSFTKENGSGATGFLPGGIGIYTKEFKMPLDFENKRLTRIEFDGIYNNARVWINNKELGFHPYGYSPFSYDLTPFLNYGNKKNTIKVKVDKTAYIDSRWYPGSGIYRNVRLVSVNKQNIVQNGVYITTSDISQEKATVNISTKINNTEGEKTIILVSKILDPNGKNVQQTKSRLNLNTKSTLETKYNITINRPKLWDTKNPNLYTLVSELYLNQEKVDETSSTFGFRTIKYDKDKGFFLNGKSTKFKGVCLHHDCGLVGAAVPRDVWIRRLKKLKEAGVNAIRTSHNPQSKVFLDLCDKMGFLVQAEFFDEFSNPKDKVSNYNQKEKNKLTEGYSNYFDKWCEEDIKTTILRDRNHPSIVMWSIGNEIEWEYPEYEQAAGYWDKNRPKNVSYYNNEPFLSKKEIEKRFWDQNKNELANTAKRLSGVVKKYDLTRPVTANLVIPSVSCFSGYSDALDIVGLSYRHAVYDYIHKNYPDKMIFGSENWVRYNEWEPVLKRDFVAGIFVWTGADYMGESHEWPKKGSSSGMLDFISFPKPSYYMMKSLWSEKPMITFYTKELKDSPYMLSNKPNNDNTKNVVERTKDWWKTQHWGWHNLNEFWKYQNNENILVEIYTNCPKVKLRLNGKSLGIKELKDNPDHKIKWCVPYKEGKLSAIGYDKDDNASAFYEMKTSTRAKTLKIETDKKSLILNDPGSAANIMATIYDTKGNIIKDREFKITFNIQGNYKLFGVDNGANDNIQDYHSKTIITHNGRALLVLGQNYEKSTIHITAKAVPIKPETENEELTSKKLSIKIK